jgi:murein tripeptide amidase MpaA
LNINRYFNNDELDEYLKYWEREYPDLYSLSKIGTSFEGKPIWLITLTNKQKGTDIEKPAVWADANIHATEISGTTAILTLTHHLLVNFTNDPEIRDLLNSCTFYLVPRINPDGAELALAANPRFIRSGVRPYPWTDKGDGLHPEDIDGDGRILQMRLPDPNGDWKISSLDPRLMEKRFPEERGGQYYRLMAEGKIENYDGFVIKTAPPHQGLDFNRNFPFEWRPESDQSGAGPYPVSEPEIKSILDFIISHPNINIAITFHTYSRVILRPYSTKADEEMDTDDLWNFKKIGEIGTRLTGYRCVSTYHDFRYHPKEVTTGAFDDWIYDHLGIFCYTIELWDLPSEAGIKDRKLIEWWREHPHEDDLKILQWIDQNAQADGYVNWYPYQHPQLGLVELGGWNSIFTWRNPPVDFIEKESKLHIPFMLALAELLPHLSIFSCNATRIDGKTFHINLVVENTGFLPTYTSQQGKKRKATRPVRVELEIPEDAELINGERKQDLGHLEGRSNKLSVSSTMGSSPTDNRSRVEWTLLASPGTMITFHISGDRVGKISQTISLE